MLILLTLCQRVDKLRYLTGIFYKVFDEIRLFGPEKMSVLRGLFRKVYFGAMKKFLLGLSVLLLFPFVANAQVEREVEKSVKIYFRQGAVVLDEVYCCDVELRMLDLILLVDLFESEA